MQQDTSTRIPPPYPPPPQGSNFNSTPPQNQGNYQTMNPNTGTINSTHRVDISNVLGYHSLKTIMSILYFLGIFFLVLLPISFFIGIGLLSDRKEIVPGIILMIGGILIFGLGALSMFAARDNIKIKIEHLEVSYKILDALTIGKN